jgi:hypothetical protein
LLGDLAALPPVAAAAVLAPQAEHRTVAPVCTRPLQALQSLAPVVVVLLLAVTHRGREAWAVAAMLLVVLAPSTPEVVVLEIGHTASLAAPVVLEW